MKKLFDTSFFGLLAENSPEVSTQEMKNAYGNFVEHVETVSSGSDYATIYRTLNITRINDLQRITRPKNRNNAIR